MALTYEMLEQLGRELRPIILKDRRPDSCIYTASLAAATMRRLGSDAYALAVTCGVLNPALANYIAGRDAFSWDDPNVPEGAWGVGIGMELDRPAEADEWVGHLVAICDRRWLCDYSIDQANRPERGIMIDLLVWPVTEAFLRGHERLVIRAENGGVVTYDARPGDKSYRASVEWERGQTAPVHAETVRA